MTIHRRVVAMGFRLVGFGIAVPSLISFAGLTAAVLSLPQTPAAEVSRQVDVGTEGLVGLLVIFVRVVGAALGFLGGAMTWVMMLLAAASLVFSIVGFVLHTIGRGIQRHARWARILAILMLAGPILLMLAAPLILPREWLFFYLVVGAVLVYPVWVLVWRFN